MWEIGEFRVDAAQRALLTADGARVPLSSRAFELLMYFVRHPGELLDKNRLMKAVWPSTVVEENNLNQCIGAIRKALGDSPADRRYLVTEPGRGYRFVAPVRPTAPASTPTAAPTLAPPAGSAAAPASPAAVLRRRRSLALAAIGIAAAAAALLWWQRAPAPLTDRSIADRSIAVLPFENRSESRESDYLALGIQDEVLTLLTRIGELRVIPRASTLKYTDSTATVTEIGRELDVAFLLDGSVQRAGDTVRVNVTLIDAAADRHLWADTYERKATDVFAIESEVAQAVARALEARVTAQERAVITRPPTANPQAYDRYLRARSAAERTTRTEGEILDAIANYEEAVRLDPEFTIAWAQLSRRHANLFSLAYDRSERRRTAALDALLQAEKLAPDRIDTQLARAYFLFVVEGDLEGMERLLRAFDGPSPPTADVTGGLAQVTQELGQHERSTQYWRRTLELDPFNPYRHAITCQDYATSRELEVAAQTCERALELLPADAGILAIYATVRQSRGELDQARGLLASLTPAPGDWRSLRALSKQMLLDRKPRDAAALLDKYLVDATALGTRRGVVRRWLADARRLAGDAQGARAAYAIARTELDTELALQDRNPVLIAELVIVQARLGERAAALDLANRCDAAATKPFRQTYIEDCIFARAQAEMATGEPARAVALLAALASAPGQMPPITGAVLRLDPDFDELRGREDFAALL